MQAARSAAAAAIALLPWLLLGPAPAAAVVVAARGREGTSEPELTPAVAQDAAARAGIAAKQAWTWVKQVKAATEANMKYIPMAKAQVDMAKTAAETAAEEDKAVTTYLQEVRAKADDSAMQAAMDFMSRVKQKLEDEKAKAVSDQSSMERKAQEDAAKAAISAAKPYHAMLLRGQKVIQDYFKRAQELAAVSNHLRSEGMRLAGSADAYQQNNEPIKASQIMMTAHNMMAQADTMKQEASRLQESALEVNDALPVWQMAEQAAVAYGAETANPRKFQYAAPPLT